MNKISQLEAYKISIILEDVSIITKLNNFQSLRKVLLSLFIFIVKINLSKVTRFLFKLFT